MKTLVAISPMVMCTSAPESPSQRGRTVMKTQA